MLFGPSSLELTNDLGLWYRVCSIERQLRLSGSLPGDTHPPYRTGGLASRIAFHRFVNRQRRVKAWGSTVSLGDWSGRYPRRRANIGSERCQRS